MKKTIGLFILFSLSVSAFAQGNKDFGRLGIGTGLSDRPSYSFDIEYGKTFRHLEVSLKFSYFFIPIGNLHYLSIFYKDRGDWQDISHSGPGRNGTYSGKENLSLTLNVGYNILSQFSEKHNFTPFIAAGYGSITKIDNITAENMGSLTYDYRSAFEYGFGTRYEYALNSKLRLGVYYEYYNHLERDILGVNICRTF
ncbi:MAG: porin family protein [Tannerellaceae bacterium]|jgi:hypothetical protein|nr:porin family protein [Tannerellaceae bacterium]